MPEKWQIEKLDRWGIHKAPAGIYLTRGDGVAVQVTVDLVMKARKSRKDLKAADRKRFAQMAQADLDRTTRELLEAAADADPA